MAQVNFVDVNPNLPLVPGKYYAIQYRVPFPFSSFWQAAITDGIKAWSALTDKINIRFITFNNEAPSKSFVVEVDFFYQPASVSEAGIDFRGIAALILAATFAIASANGTILKFATAADTTAKGLFSPVTIIVIGIIAALFLFKGGLQRG
jgi:hypothetical protein